MPPPAIVLPDHRMAGRFLDHQQSANFGRRPDDRVVLVTSAAGRTAELGELLHQLCCSHYPDAVWPTQIADALRALIHQANLAREQGHTSIPAQVADPLHELFRQGELVGLSQTTTAGPAPGQRKARLLLEVLRDREADVLRFSRDLNVPPTSNQAERDLRPAKVQQNISGLRAAHQRKRTQDRYVIRGYLSTSVIHGRNAMAVLRQAIAGEPWLPPYPAPT